MTFTQTQSKNIGGRICRPCGSPISGGEHAVVETRWTVTIRRGIRRAFVAAQHADCASGLRVIIA